MNVSDPIRRVPGVSTGHVGRPPLIHTMRQSYPDLVILPAHVPGTASRLAQATGQAPTLATA